MTTVRVRVEQIQLAVPFDPALAEGSATLHLRLNLDGQTVTRATLEDLDVPEFDSRGQTVRLEADLGEATVWVGSELAVIVAGRSAQAPSATRDVRGSLTLTGDPRTWPGVHRSSVDSPGQWRLQIRIDEATAQNRHRWTGVCDTVAHNMAHSRAPALARTNVTLPATLLEEVDRFAGPRGRSRYVAEAVAQRVRRDAVGAAIRETAGAMVGQAGLDQPGRGR